MKTTNYKTPASKKPAGKPPGFAVEFGFISLNLLFLKLYSENAFFTTSFFSVLIPLMAYQVITLLGNLLRFIQFMQMEEDDGSFMSKKQMKLLFKVLMNLMSYFGLYFASV